MDKHIKNTEKKLGNKQHIAPRQFRVGVIGAGNMGQHHLRAYNMLPNAKLVGVVDIDEKRNEAAARKYHCEAYASMEDLIGKVDAVSIAVPSHLHASVGDFFLDHNVHCLIEKPLALSENECLRLIKKAEKKGLILLVGHVEHFNPGVQTLAQILKQEASEIYALESKRMGFNAHRIPDIDVVMDLMVHDLEIIRFLCQEGLQDKTSENEAVTNLSACGFSRHNDGNVDQASGFISFSSGAIATLSASWVSAKKSRTLEVSADIGTLCLDYATQKLVLYRNPMKVTHSCFPSGQNTYYTEAQMEHIFVRYQEPLLLELQNFLQSVDAGVPLGVTGYQALDALKLAWKIQAKVREKEVLESRV